MSAKVLIDRDLLERLADIAEIEGQPEGTTARALLEHGNDHNSDECKRFAGELWAVHAQGPDDIYPAFDRADAERHAAELNAIPTPAGVSVAAVVIPSPMSPLEHWKELAEQEREHKAQVIASAAQPAPVVPEVRREWPDDEIVSAWKWCEENGVTPAEFLSHSLLVKRSRVLGRPLTWREAIELTAITTDMPDEQRDKLLAMDDAAPAQGQQVECKECERWRKNNDHLAAEVTRLGVKVGQQAAELSALKAQQVGQEPFGYLADDGGAMTAFFRAEDKDQFDAFCAEAEPLNKVALYTAPQPAPAQDVARLAQLLRVARTQLEDSGISHVLKGQIHAALAAHDKQSGGE